ncbi:NUDIX hydrolase [Fulvivirga sp. 2943]|uniref:NUDIX hydrolase n=2 Tax=Fulvivirga sediminis TaxID=2803949 RepID=A0A937F402_9BACT|nr:NUDIX hydrolase [Fulvivirga sediminis]
MKLKNKDVWALPGGFVRKDKDVDDEAKAVLQERTGLTDIFLHQFHSFGSVSRQDPKHASDLVEMGVIDPTMEEWFKQRYVSIGYYALVEYSKVKLPIPDATSDYCSWVPINDLPKLVIDHESIIGKAHQTLKKELNYQPIGFNLLPELFTMPELQALYETLLQSKLDRRNFRRKMLAYGILIDTNQKREGVGHKAPILYRFDLEKYFSAIKDGFSSGW